MDCYNPSGNNAGESIGVLRAMLVKNNDLLKALKQHRRQSKAIQKHLATLKQLKTLDV